MEMTYFSEAQLPKSINRHRSLQKGISGLSKVTSFLQIGHLILGHSVSEPIPWLTPGVITPSRKGGDPEI